MGDEFGDQRIVVRGHHIPIVQMRVDAHTGSAWGMEGFHLAGGWAKSSRVFGVDTAFDRVPADHHVFLSDREPLASRHRELLFNNVDPGDHLGHRMFDLHTRIHFDEIELAVFK